MNEHRLCLKYITLLAALLGACLGASSAAAYPIGHRSIVYVDPERENRQIQTELYYPAATAGEEVPVAEPPAGGFPVLSFGHGFLLPWSLYAYLWEGLVPEGYIMAFPRTEGGIAPSHLEFGRDLAFLLRALLNESADPLSPFHGKVSDAGAALGHSMGGGASVLAAAEDPDIDAIANLAAAETQPSAIAAAASVQARALLLAGSDDCVTPPAQHQLPIYGALASDCKTFVELTGASHCQFGAYNFTCSLGEIGCSSPGLSREEQQQLTLQLLTPWLAFALYEDGSAWYEFQTLLAGSPAWTYQQDCESTGVHPWQAAPSSLIRILVAPAVFSRSARIEIELTEAAAVHAALYDAGGRLVRRLGENRLSAGRHVYEWDGRDEAGRRMCSGLYLLNLRAQGEEEQARLLLVR